jgi:3-oxoacyl-ACP reductase-like protein
MGLFDSIKHAIFGDKGPLGSWAKDAPAAPAAPAAPSAAPRPAAAPAAPTPNAAPAAAAPTPTPTAAPVDVEAILTQKAAAYSKPNNWRTSIVDLLTLLGLDSSLQARKELGQELGVHAGADGSAEQNIALHKAVMQALAKNGGKVPAELTD